MSRWGNGNFESDSSNDYLTEIVYKLFDSIQKCLEELPTNDICGNASLMPAVDILVTLGTAYPHVVVHMLEEQDIDHWQKTYLSIFDRRDYGYDRSGRREIIVQTFSNLKNIVDTM